MTKLHEVLAVEADQEGIAKRIMEESRNVFKNKHNLFVGLNKTLKMNTEGNEALEEASAESIGITTTVPNRLDYTSEAVSNWLDVVLTKELTNYNNAKADLVVDGHTIMVDVPATFLLNLEKNLKQIRSVYESIPTLNQSIQWQEDINGELGTYISMEPEIRTKTQKTPNFRVLYEATDRHPAQIEKWMEEQVVGKYTTYHKSGMISSAKKAEFLGRIDKLIQATKQARMRANDVEIVDKKIGKAIFEYIHK